MPDPLSWEGQSRSFRKINRVGNPRELVTPSPERGTLPKGGEGDYYKRIFDKPSRDYYRTMRKGDRQMLAARGNIRYSGRRSKR
jgi:hypothetical protein